MIVGAAGKQVLLLWDVDHTLIENSGVSKAVYARVFEMMTGRAPQVQPGTDGRTDYEIVRNLFTANGAVFTADGKNELDAAMMDGATLKAGAVAGVTRTKNPISLARAVTVRPLGSLAVNVRSPSSRASRRASKRAGSSQSHQ